MALGEQSILTSVKKVIGFDEDYDVFDIDLIMHINTVFSVLHQLGVGPTTPFSIDDKDAKWQDFTGDESAINSVKTYVAIKVRLIFDPPATSFAITSFEKIASELEWRLNVQAEGKAHPWVPPTESIPITS